MAPIYQCFAVSLFNRNFPLGYVRGDPMAPEVPGPPVPAWCAHPRRRRSPRMRYRWCITLAVALASMLAAGSASAAVTAGPHGSVRPAALSVRGFRPDGIGLGPSCGPAAPGGEHQLVRVRRHRRDRGVHQRVGKLDRANRNLLDAPGPVLKLLGGPGWLQQ